MLPLLTELCEQGNYISLYHDASSKFDYGRILCVNENEIAIYMLAPNGTFDGIWAGPTDNFSRVETDGPYVQRMEKLSSLSELPPFNYPLNPDKIVKSLLAVVLEARQIVSIELLDSGYFDLVGFVEEMQNTFCKIHLVDSYGLDDGFAYIKFRDITRLSYGSEDERLVQNLWKLNSKKPSTN